MGYGEGVLAYQNWSCTEWTWSLLPSAQGFTQRFNCRSFAECPGCTDDIHSASVPELDVERERYLRKWNVA